MKKYTIIAGIMSAALLISGCSSSKEASAEPKKIKSGYKAEHLHGIAYASDQNIYVATHEGMLATNLKGESWTMKGAYDFDFMGYNVMSDGTMITSGHPGKTSNLPNPLGLMVSENNGEKWESKALMGKVDFHILSSNFSNPQVIYGISQMDSGVYKSGLYKSTDKGENWDYVKSTGLPKDLHQMYALTSLPNDENYLIAGTENGVLHSKDGGKTWEAYEPERLITAISVIPETKELMAYSVTNNKAGVVKSPDNGKTWIYQGLDLGQDAVAYFGINPTDSDKIAISTFENSVYSTEDGGQNWNTLLDKGIIQ